MGGDTARVASRAAVVYNVSNRKCEADHITVMVVHTRVGAVRGHDEE